MKIISDKELKELLEKAERFRGALGNSILGLKESFDCFNQIIDYVPTHPYYFSERAEVKYRLGYLLANRDLLNSAIEDINKAIQLDPDEGMYYRVRASYLWEKSDDEPTFDKKMHILESVIADCKFCLRKQPMEPGAWLTSIAVDIVTRNYDDVISLYGQCKLYMDNQENQLLRAYLGCLGLILLGEPLEEDDTKCLYDQLIQLDRVFSREWRITIFLGDSHTKEAYGEKWNNVGELMRLFISHYRNSVDRTNMLRNLGLIDMPI